MTNSLSLWTMTRRSLAAIFTMLAAVALAAPAAAGVPTATLTYSKTPHIYRAEVFTITVAYSEPVTPASAAITITGGTADTANDISPAQILSEVADATTYTFSYTPTSGVDDGSFLIEVSGDSTSTSDPLAVQPSDNTFTIDTAAPVATVVYDPAGPDYTPGSLAVTATYTEDIATDGTPTLTFSGTGSGSVSPVSPSASRVSATEFVFAVTVTTTPTADGGSPYTATVSGGTDLAGNTAADDVQTGVIDTVAPTATLSFSQADRLYKAEAFAVTAVFNESLTATPTITIVGDASGDGSNDVGTTNLSGSGTTWTFSQTIASTTDDGAFTITLTAVDPTGNALVTQPVTRTFTIDTAAPTVSGALEFSRGPSFLKSGALSITANYSEDVASDATPTLAFTASASNFTLGGSSRVSPTQFVYSVTVGGTTPQTGQTFTAAVGSGTDLAGNPQAVSATQSGTVDTRAPTVSLAYSKSIFNVGTGNLVITATFVEDITPTTPTISIDRIGTGNDVSGAPMSSTGDPTVWTYTYNVLAANGSTVFDGSAGVDVSGADAAGNTNSGESNDFFNIDTQGPVPTLTFSKSSTAVGAGDLSITATFNENLSTTPTITIDRPGGTSNDVTSQDLTSTADPKVWTFVYTVQPAGGGATDGSAPITISNALDAASNANQTASPNSMTIDTTKPTVSITYDKTSPVGSGNLVITAQFVESIAVTPSIQVDRPGDGNDISPTSSMSATADSKIWTRTYSVSTQNGGTIQDGSTAVTVTAAQDPAGNTMDPAASSFVVDTIKPTVSALTFSNTNRKYRAGAFQVTATFSESLASTPTIDITRVTGSGDGSNERTPAMDMSGNGITWTFSYTITPTADDGTFICDFAATDAAGNVLTAQPANRSFTVDTVAPTATSLSFNKSGRLYTAETLVVTATFSETVVTPSILIAGGQASTANDITPTQSMTGSGTVWSFSYGLTSTIDDGSFTITLTAADEHGNDLASQPSPRDFSVDTVPPTASLTFSKASRIYKAETFTVTADFTEPVVATPTITLAGGTASGANDVTNALMSGSGTSWTYSRAVSDSPADDGSFTITLTASDANDNGLATQPSLRDFTVDTVAPAAPALAFSRGPALIGPGGLTVTATFGEAIGSTPTMTFSGTGASTAFTETGPAATRISDTVFVYATSVDTTLTAQAGDDYTATVPAASVTDLAGNTQSAASATGGGVVDTNPPAGALSFSRGPALLAPGSLVVTADYTEAVASDSTPTLTFSGLGATIAIAPLSPAAIRISATQFVYSTTVDTTATSQEGDPYTATLSGGADAAGNTATGDVEAGTVDTTAPSGALTFTSPGPAFLKPGSLTVTADYTEAIAADTTPTLTFSGAGATAAITNPTPTAARISATQFVFSTTVDTTATAQEGEPYTATLAGGADASGNSAGGDAETGLVDTTAPSGSLTFSRGPALLKPGSLTVTADYTEAIAADATPTLTFSGVGASTAITSLTPAAARLSPTQFVYSTTIDTTATAQEGEPYTATLAGGADAAGNSAGGDVDTGTIDTAAPAGSLTFSRGPALLKPGSLTVTADFSEAIVADTTPTLTFSGTGATAAISNPTPAATRISATQFVYSTTVDATTTAQEGEPYTATLAGGEDQAGNPAVGDVETGVVDTVAPAGSLTFSRGPALLKPGTLAVTADFSEAIAADTTPTLTFSGAGATIAITTLSPAASRISATQFVYSTTVDTTATAQEGEPYTATLTGGEDASGNAATGDAETGLVDTVAPAGTLTFSRGPAFLSPGSLTVTADYNEPVAASTTPTLTFSGAGATTAITSLTPAASRVSPTQFVYSTTVDTTATSPAGDPYTATLAGGEDAAGNVAGGDVETGTVDTVVASGALTFSRGPAFLSPGSLTVTADYSEAIAADATPTLAFTGAGATTAVDDLAPAAARISPTQFVYSTAIGITPTAQDGDPYTATLSGGLDLSGNAATGDAETGTIDTVVPHATLDFSRGPDYIAAGSLTVTADFDEPIDLTPSLVFSGTGATTSIQTLDPVASRVSDTRFVYSTTIDTTATSTGGDPYTATASGATDPSGNVQQVATQSGTIDTTPPPAPTFEFSRGPDFIKSGALAVTVTFVEALALDVTPTLVFTGAAAGTVSPASATPTRISPTVIAFATTVNNSPSTPQGGSSYTATVAAATVVDRAGNTQTDSDAIQNGVIDNRIPSVFLDYSKDQTAVGLGALTITATFIEAMAATPTMEINRPGTGNDVTATFMSPGADASEWTFVYNVTAAVSPTFDGSTQCTVVGQDPAGNQNASTGNRNFTVDTAGPVPTLTFSQNRNAVNAGNLTVTATFNENIYTTPSLTIDRPGTGNDVTAQAMTATGDPAVFTFVYVVAVHAAGIDDGSAPLTITGAQDLAGNENQTALNNSIVIDTTNPTVALTYGKPQSAVGPGGLDVTATFSEAIVNTPKISVDRPGTGNDVSLASMSPTAQSTVWLFTYSVAVQNGASTLDSPPDVTVAVSAGQDLAGNANDPATNTAFAVDTITPTVALLELDDPDRKYKAQPLTLTATFSETLGTTPTVTLQGGNFVSTVNDRLAQPMSGAGAVWTFSYDITGTGTDDGTFGISFAAQDPAGNALTAQPADQFTVDTVAPTASLTFSKASRLFKAETLTVTATFSESLGATPTIEIAGGLTPTTNDVLASSMAGGGSVWTFSYALGASPLDDGAFALTLTAVDESGNALIEQPAVRTFDVDTAAPAATLSFSKSPAAYRLSESVALTVVFSEPVVATPTVSYTDGDASPANDVSSSLLSGAGTSWTFARAVAAGDDGAFTVTLSAEDAAGNGLSAQPAARVFTIDSDAPLAPSLSFSRGPAFLIGGSFSVTADFAEALSADVTPSLVFTGAPVFSPLNPVPARVSPTQFVFTTTVDSTPIAQDGEAYSATIASASVVDLAGNVQAPPDAVFSGIADNQLPSASLEFSKPGRKYRAQTFTVTATFDETVQSAPTILVTGDAGGNGANDVSPASSMSGAGTVWTFTYDITPTVDDGAFEITLSALDIAGNGLAAQPVTRTFDADTVAPVAALSFSDPTPAFLAAGALTVTATYSEDLAADSTPTLTWSPPANFTVDSAARVSGSVFVFSVTVGGSTPAAGAPYTATVSGGTDPADNVQQPASAAGIVDTAVPSVSSITFSDPTPAFLVAGQLGVTASFTEGLSADGTPTLSWSPAGNFVVDATARASDSVFLYSVTVTGTTPQDGTAYTATVAGGLDGSGNTHATAESAGIVDTIAPATPVVTFSRGPALLASGALAVTADFVEAIAADATPTLAFTGPAASRFVTPAVARVAPTRFTYATSVTASTAQAGDAYTATFPAAGVADVAGNAQSGSDTVFSGLADTEPPHPVLSYSKASTNVGTGPLTITATFDEALATTPAIQIDRPGTGNDVAPTAMSSSGNGAVWTFVYTVLDKNDTTILDGTAAVSVSGAQDPVGNPATAAANGSFVVQSTARLKVLSVAASKSVVSRGQTATVTMSVRNTGGTTAAITARSLSFNGSQSGYSVTPVSGPSTLASQADADFTFSVLVQGSAPLGLTAIDGSVSGTDMNDPALTTSDSTADASATWTVETATLLSVLSVRTASQRVTLGQTSVAVTVVVSNSGQAAANLATATLQLVSTGPVDETTHYAVRPSPSNPSAVAGGVTATYAFDVDVLSNAGLGLTTVDAAASGVDANSGSVASASASLATTSWIVERAAALAASISSVASAVRGQAFTYSATVANTGDSSATGVLASLAYSDPRIRVAAAGTHATVLAGGVTATFAFDVTVPLTATAANTTATFLLTATDATDSRSLSAGDVRLLAVLNNVPTALAPAALTATTTSPVALDGTGSFDGPAAGQSEGDALSYSWSVLTQPTASALTATSFVPNGSPLAGSTLLTPRLKGNYQIGLVVNDSHDDSTQAITALVVVNTAPSAGAGAGRAIAIGQSTGLDGSATDPDVEDTLTYSWQVSTRPSGSAAGTAAFVPNDSPSAATPTFTPDVPGAYVVSLTVSDGTATSAVSTIAVDVTNAQPVASAGFDGNVFVGQTAVLDGRASSDPDAPNGLTYTWTFDAVAANSALVSSNISPSGPSFSPQATFVPDRRGQYTLRLTVSDGFASAADTVLVTAPNRAPSASIAVPAGRVIDQPATADGSGSTDLDGDTLLYRWGLVAPAASALTTASLSPNSTAAAVRTSFVPDVRGTYRLTLEVDDGVARSTVSSFDVLVNDLPPIANAGADRSGTATAQVTLDGTLSTDPEGLSITHHWRIVSAPAGSALSTASFSPNGTVSSAVTRFTPDRKGSTVVGLVVNDGVLDSLVDTATVNVSNSPPTVAASSTSGSLRSTVTVDGTASSDPNGEDQLIYHWTLFQIPSGSAVRTSSLRPNDTTAAGRTTFTPDVPGQYILTLRVEDGTVLSEAITVNVNVTNTRPVAAAGTPQTTTAATLARLDGSSSSDADPATLLTYKWTFESLPAASRVTTAGIQPNNARSAARPFFQPDAKGTYRVRLIVNDDLVDSAASTTTVTLTNTAPIAAFTAPSTVPAGTVVTLQGQGLDPNPEDTLSYTWSLVSGPLTPTFSPNGSPAAFTTTFTASVAGTYHVRLTVSDGTAVSQPAERNVTATLVVNDPPVARVSGDLVGRTTAAVALDGSGSADPESVPLVYRWRVLAGAGVSSVTPNDSTTAVRPLFRSTVKGRYTLQLVVNDGAQDSQPVTFAVDILNTRPAASVPSVSVLTEVRRLVELTGSATDPDASDVLTYRWHFTAVPQGSLVVDASLGTNNSTDPRTSFTPDAAGDYVLELTASDGTERSVAVFARVQAFTAGLLPSAPVAKIVAQQLSGGPHLVELVGSSSTDADGDISAYDWSLVSAPAGAATTAVSGPALRYDAFVAGEYVFRLVVTDARELTGSAVVTITVDDVAPAADAGVPQQAVLTRAGVVTTAETTLSVRLDATQSSDANRTPVSYEWRVVRAPDLGAAPGGGSLLATFDDATSPAPRVTFGTARLGDAGSPMAAAGAYEFEVTARSGSLASTAAVEVTMYDPITRLPAADAGLSRDYTMARNADNTLAATFPDPLSNGTLRDYIQLDGRDSSDPQRLPLTYNWSVAERPAGSSVTLAAARTAFPSFRPDLPGRYEFELRVRNGFYESVPDRVAIGVALGNTAPRAVVLAEDLTTVRSRSFLQPYLTVPPGRRVVLNGSRSNDSDAGDRLSYAWTQTAGRTVSLLPSPMAPTISFATDVEGSRTFRLTVTDTRGSSDFTLITVIVARDVLPGLSLRATAETTTAIGIGLDNEVTVGVVRSLRVSRGTTVTLTADLDGNPSNQRFDFAWRQVAGPPVLLSNAGERDTRALRSQTAFAPTTSRVHVFECTVALRNNQGIPSGLYLRKIVRVIVDSEDSSVPEANFAITPVAVPFVGTAGERTVVLDGSSSRLVRDLGRAVAVTYAWRQITGPRGVISNPFAVRTEFTAPEMVSVAPIEYIFELTVDATPPGDRSEPLYLVVTQQGTAGQQVRLFIGDTPLGTAPGTLAADGSTTLAGVSLPAGTADGAVVTLEVVDASGVRTTPAQVLRTYTLQLSTQGPTDLVFGASGIVAVNISLVGGPGVTARVLATSPSVGGATGEAGEGGGGGCRLAAASGAAAWLDLLALLFPLALVERRRRARARD
ncbi:MAG: hypothetical protein HY816_01405 [Candidatus Wallbacteria bacterium]|nr:hypothetical protein [Candidatus Wallbacteria bacterium]